MTQTNVIGNKSELNTLIRQKKWLKQNNGQTFHLKLNRKQTK